MSMIIWPRPVVTMWLALVFVSAPCLRAQSAPSVPTPQLGVIAFPTSGAAAAQPAFIRGVLLLHNFEYEAAAASFREAQRIEPRFAMAYWGEALTYTHQVWKEQDLDSARLALGKLGATAELRSSAAPTPRERAYLAAVEALYGEGTRAHRDTAYADAMDGVMRAFPDDDEAAILYATALFGLPQEARDVPLYMRAGAIAEDVFRRNPRHPGAAHMIIHAFDDPTHAPLALQAARAYSTIAPQSAHAQHMTTHIYLALGLWPEVVAWNIVAAGPDTSKWGPFHAEAWLLYGYLQQGKSATARALVQTLAAHYPRERARGRAANLRARYVVEARAWDGPEATMLVADTGRKGEDDYEYATFAAGYAAAMRGDTVLARRMLARLDRIVAAAGSVKPGARGVLAAPIIQALSLRAALLTRAGRAREAIELLRRAAAFEDGMPVEFGPPAVLAPTHELLGAALSAAGDHAAAAAEYSTALQLQPGRSAALLGGARESRAIGRSADATKWYRQLADNWREAEDAALPLDEVRRAAGRQ
jgi:tetratricopeptide (TPR) repeat protein